jgi:hypothetical protein
MTATTATTPTRRNILVNFTAYPCNKISRPLSHSQRLARCKGPSKIDEVNVCCGQRFSQEPTSDASESSNSVGRQQSQRAWPTAFCKIAVGAQDFSYDSSCRTRRIDDLDRVTNSGRYGVSQ